MKLAVRIDGEGGNRARLRAERVRERAIRAALDALAEQQRLSSPREAGPMPESAPQATTSATARG